jgi:hypothetical protein
MTERDDELKKILRRWEAPEPGEGLDARVRDSWRQSSVQGSGRGGGKARWWMAVAAGVALVVGFAHLQQPVREPVRLASATNAHGFRPLPNGAITVVKGKRRQ